MSRGHFVEPTLLTGFSWRQHTAGQLMGAQVYERPGSEPAREDEHRPRRERSDDDHRHAPLEQPLVDEVPLILRRVRHAQRT